MLNPCAALNCLRRLSQLEVRDGRCHRSNVECCCVPAQLQRQRLCHWRAPMALFLGWGICGAFICRCLPYEAARTTRVAHNSSAPLACAAHPLLCAAHPSTPAPSGPPLPGAGDPGARALPAGAAPPAIPLHTHQLGPGSGLPLRRRQGPNPGGSGGARAPGTAAPAQRAVLPPGKALRRREGVGLSVRSGTHAAR